MNFNNNLARINISNQEVLDILKNRQIMKNKYLNNYQGYESDILSIHLYKEKRRKEWIKLELKNRIPWYLSIIDILGCVNSQNYIKSLYDEIEKMSHSII